MNVKELLTSIAEAIEYEGELHLNQNIEDIEEWDSLGVLSIVSTMDDLSISINLEDLEEIKTVEEFVRLTGIHND
tara:strand:+ start:308 stop:532 length:225 start_codon:yes stop_codon:yes gene_type:complete